MRFTRLRLNGFKSFVDPTDLVIANGLTGVVGPNGCGKSNLLEALRWVMGETRPSAMRGGGMEDVIFAGASTRPARNFAEVQLVLDNTERLAPSGFNDADQLDIVRRITRDSGSSYKANTRDVRARDIQMLFADASTGAHSPALVRQGQISELINAKPKSRRRILEEAAGISGLYQRRHEAELKLNGAEANLLRVDDVVGQLAGQVAQLARQVKQAARYRKIGEGLRHAEGVLLYRRWAEALATRDAAKAVLKDRMAQTTTAERAVVKAENNRVQHDNALPALREEATVAAAVLQRLQGELGSLGQDEKRAQATIDTLTGRIAQLTQDINREAALNTDAADTVAQLEVELAELTKAEDGHDARLAQATEAARLAAATVHATENRLSEQTEDVARLAARHQSVQRLIEEAQKGLLRHESAARQARETVLNAGVTVQKARDLAQQATGQQATAARAAIDAEAALLAADMARTDAATKEAEARAIRSAAEGEAGALRAEMTALARLVARKTGEGAQLLDLVSVDVGYEAALGAALADDLHAPVVDAVNTPSGWADLPDYDTPLALPIGAVCLADYMTMPPLLRRRMAQVGIVDGADGTRMQMELHPGQRLVSMQGDLWRWDGFRVAAKDAPSAAALRLQQVNRLTALKRELEGVNARAVQAAQAHDALTVQLTELTEADRQARQARRDADTKSADASRALSRAESDRSLAQTRLDAADLAVARHVDDAKGAQARLTEAQSVQLGLPDFAVARAQIEGMKRDVLEARSAMIAQRAAQDDLRRMGEARIKRRQDILKAASGWQARLKTAESRAAELSDRKAMAEAELSQARSTPTEIAARRDKLADGLERAQARGKTAAATLAQGEAAFREAELALREAQKAASALREGRGAAQAKAEVAQNVLETAAQRIMEEQETTPADLLKQLGVPFENMAKSTAIEAEIHRLRRQRDQLGAVNLRAEEDSATVQAEHAALVTERADLEDAIRTLRSGVAALNKEGRERLLAAFEQVNRNFAMLFRSLFGGGEARLELVESDDPLDAGLEIMCQPPGKKLSTLSLLSGGEQTLTAMALIFAVFLANPAPICVLDEVDAPLDDANVTRFCDLLDEMTQRTDTRFLIITHHAVTMARMHRLFGVTMQEQGVSQLVSVDLRKAEMLVT